MKYYIPDSVIAYIQENRLYKSTVNQTEEKRRKSDNGNTLEEDRRETEERTGC